MKTLLLVFQDGNTQIHKLPDAPPIVRLPIKTATIPSYFYPVTHVKQAYTTFKRIGKHTDEQIIYEEVI